MKFLHPRNAMLFALVIGVAAAAAVIAYAGSEHVDVHAAPQPVQMSIPF